MKAEKMKVWIGTNPILCEQIQKILFSLGYGWRRGKDKTISNLRADSLYVNYFVENQLDWNDSGKDYFDAEEGLEINIDWLRQLNEPDTIELNGKKYLKSELEEALKHLKPIED